MHHRRNAGDDQVLIPSAWLKRATRPAFSKFEIISGRLVELIGPGVNDGLLIEIVHGSHDPILEFLFGRDADVAEDGAGKFREEALDEVEPGAVLGSEG